MNFFFVLCVFCIETMHVRWWWKMNFFFIHSFIHLQLKQLKWNVVFFSFSLLWLHCCCCCCWTTNCSYNNVSNHHHHHNHCQLWRAIFLLLGPRNWNCLEKWLWLLWMQSHTQCDLGTLTTSLCAKKFFLIFVPGYNHHLENGFRIFSTG